MTTEERIAPDSKVWVCTACGKTSKDRYGDPNTSWDWSCMLNSILCDETKLVKEGGRVVRVNE